MFFNRIIVRILHNYKILHRLAATRTFCVIYNKNFDYFRSKGEYKNSVVQLNSDFNQSKVTGSGFSFLLKDHNIQTDEYFSHLTQRENVMKLTSIQVKELLYLMANIKIDTSKYVTILNYLDEKCALSAERWPLDLTFYVLDAWFIIWGAKTFRKHYYSAITNLWGRRMKKCSKNNLILMLYFIGVSKVCPPFLMETIEDRMESFTTHFSSEELAVACLSFFKTSRRINSDVLLQQACLAAEKLLLKNDRFNAISILKCLRMCKYYDAKLWNSLKEYTMRESETFNFVECTNFLAIFAAQNVYDEGIFNLLEERGVLVLQNEEHFWQDYKDEKISDKIHPSLRSRIKDLARFLWVFSSVGHCMKPDTLDFLKEVIGQRIDDDLHTQTHILIDCLQSFALLGYYPHTVLSSVLQTVNLKKMYQSGRAKPKYQLYFVQKSIQIEEPNLEIDMKNIFHPIPKSLEKDIKEREGFKELVNMLNKTSMEIRMCYLVPHIMISGIILSVPNRDSADKSRDKLEVYKKYIADGIISKQAEDIFQANKDFICIEILDSTVCANGTTKPLGLMKAKIRQLNKLNLRVVTLTTEEIQKLATKDIPQNCDDIDKLMN